MLKVTCHDCGNKVREDEAEELEDKMLCPDCKDCYYTCEECGQTIYEDETHKYHGDTVCETCFNEHFSNCDCCEGAYDLADDTWGGMCQVCCDEHFVCDGCGEIIHSDSYGEDGMCEDCYQRSSERIHGYHCGGNKGICFYPHEGEPLYFGIELETDDYKDRHGAGEELYEVSEEDALFWQEEDGSLEDGIEIITQPCTLDYHRDKFPWGRIREAVKKYGGKSEKTNAAALHIHFNKSFLDGEESELYQLRLIYLFEKFRDELLVLARTSQYLWERSAKAYRLNLFDCSPKSKMRELRQDCDRLMAVNLHSDKDTIEIRLFRGTLGRDTILASIELVDFLVRLARGTSTATLQRLTWRGLLKKIKAKDYQYLPAYLVKREADKLTGRHTPKEKDEDRAERTGEPYTLRTPMGHWILSPDAEVEWVGD